ncbi:hypothetical protein Tco_0486410 [Tanacetum coccineum]
MRLGVVIGQASSPRGRATDDLSSLINLIDSLELSSNGEDKWVWNGDALGNFKVKTLSKSVQNSLLKNDAIGDGVGGGDCGGFGSGGEGAEIMEAAVRGYGGVMWCVAMGDSGEGGFSGGCWWLRKGGARGDGEWVVRVAVDDQRRVAGGRPEMMERRRKFLWGGRSVLGFGVCVVEMEMKWKWTKVMIITAGNPNIFVVYNGFVVLLLNGVVTTSTGHNTAGDRKYWCFTDTKKSLKRYGRKEHFILPIQVSTTRVDVSTAKCCQWKVSAARSFLMLLWLYSLRLLTYSLPMTLTILGIELKAAGSKGNNMVSYCSLGHITASIDLKSFYLQALKEVNTAMREYLL